MSFTDVIATYPRANTYFAQLVSKAAAEGAVLVVNGDPAVTAYLTDSPVGNPATVDSAPLAPSQSVVLDGSRDVYCFTMNPAQTATLHLYPSGTSFFAPASLAGIGGISVFVQASAPVPGPSGFPVNSIWFNSTLQSLYTWNGAAWVQQQFDAAQLITAGTIIATLIAAGTIVAGIVNGTTITGANFIANGASGQILSYTGSPAAGNLNASVTGAALTDSPGNSVLKGITAYQPAAPGGIARAAQLDTGLIFNQAATEAGPWSITGSIVCDLINGMVFSAASGLVMNGSTTVQGGDLTLSGRSLILGDRTVPPVPVNSVAAYSDTTSGESHLKYESEDGVSYSTGRLLAAGPNNQAISSLTYIAVTGMSINLGVGKYKIQFDVWLKANANAGQWFLEIVTGGTASSVNYGFEFTSAAGVSTVTANIGALGTDLTGPATSVLGFYRAQMSGEIVMSAAGTLSINAKTSVAADTFNIFAASTIEAFPVT